MKVATWALLFHQEDYMCDSVKSCRLIEDKKKNKSGRKDEHKIGAVSPPAVKQK